MRNNATDVLLGKCVFQHLAHRRGCVPSILEGRSDLVANLDLARCILRSCKPSTTYQRPFLTTHEKV